MAGIEELVTLRAECDRLREELVTARDGVRSAETAAGRLRGALAEMRVQLDRARQDQEAHHHHRRQQRRFRLRRAISSRLQRLRRLGRP